MIRCSRKRVKGFVAIKMSLRFFWNFWDRELDRLLYRLVIRPIRALIPAYSQRPKGSEVLRAYIRQRKYPSWTSYFVRYRDIQDDNFGDKHFNFDVDGHNYHILRTGAYPYIKYHCTKRPNEDLTKENNFYRLITIINLGLPCFLYGLAAVALIRHKERVDFVKENGEKATLHIHFLIKEQHDRC